jgi:hypothetical protein
MLTSVLEIDMLTFLLAMGRTITPTPMEAPTTTVEMAARIILLPRALARNKCQVT